MDEAHQHSEDAGEDRIPKMNSLGPLIDNAVQWVQIQPNMQAAARAAQPTVEQVRMSAGPKPTRSQWPRAEHHDGSHAPVSRNREDGQAAAEYAAAMSSWEAKLEELQIQAAQAFRIPNTVEG